MKIAQYYQNSCSSKHNVPVYSEGRCYHTVGVASNGETYSGGKQLKYYIESTLLSIRDTKIVHELIIIVKVMSFMKYHF